MEAIRLMYDLIRQKNPSIEIDSSNTGDIVRVNNQVIYSTTKPNIGNLTLFLSGIVQGMRLGNEP